jgi:uncharacterized HAD superfamily protein
MKYIIDIDGTICSDTFGKYELAVPFINRIYKINQLYSQGHIIIYQTARGSTTSIDWRELTEKQLNDWGAKYHELRLGKLDGDFFVDNKGVHSDEFFKE